MNAYNTLKDWGMQMLVGTVTSTPCVAVVEETHADNMFQFTPSATAVESIQYDNAFRMCFSDPDQGKASADYISENGIATKIAVIYNALTHILQVSARNSKKKQNQWDWILWLLRHLRQTARQTSLYRFRRQKTQARSLYSFRLLSGSFPYSCAGKQCGI